MFRPRPSHLERGEFIAVVRVNLLIGHTAGVRSDLYAAQQVLPCRARVLFEHGSRTYMSTLERDLKSPTLNKLAELCEVMEIHPLTLLTLAYAGDDLQQVDQLLLQVRQELETVAKKGDAP